MEFGLLGPLIVRRGNDLVVVPHGKQRAVLAALLLSANQVVLLDEFALALWGELPPPSAEITVRNYIRRLRIVLGGTGDRIATEAGGYSIRVDAPSRLAHRRRASARGRCRAVLRTGAPDDGAPVRGFRSWTAGSYGLTRLARDFRYRCSAMLAVAFMARR